MNDKEAEENSEAKTTEEENVPTQWYALRVQSNREEEVRDSLVRALKVEEADEDLLRVLVPTESVTEVRGGDKKVVERKLFPGYVLVEVKIDEKGHVPEKLWYIIRETRGVGDFIGGEEPWPLRDEEVDRMLGKAEEKEEEAPKLQIDFKEGDMVEIQEGAFRDMQGRVEEVNPASGRVRVVVNIFGRSTSVELEYWQVESV
jgi:transcriptional antiterminator NusG